MDYETARLILREMRDSSRGDDGLGALEGDLVRSAVRYARIRVQWWMADEKGRAAIDFERRAAHDALIDGCNILSRNAAKRGRDIRWRERLGEDRKEIGDFACFLHCLIGLEAR